MRFQKLSIASVTMLAVTTMASASFADDTMKPAAPTTGVGATTVQSSTVMTPSSPSVPTTSTTTTTQGSTGTAATTSGAALPPSSPRTSTTTTTAGDMSATGIAPSTAPAARETVTLYRNQRPNRPLLITGGALLVGTYVTTAAFAGVNGPSGDKDLFIPVVGPWINIADRSCPRTDCASYDRDTALIIGSGVLQGIGAAMALTSFLVPEKIPTAQITAGPVKMHIVPSAGAASGGVGAIGTF